MRQNNLGQQLLHWLLTKVTTSFHKASAIITWIVEIIVPLLIFLSQKYQRLSAILQCMLMVAIQLAGNYATFQVISVVLMLPLLTDTDVASTRITQDKTGAEQRQAKRRNMEIIVFGQF